MQERSSIAIERDPVLAAGLRHRFRDVEIVTGDAAAHAWPEVPFSVVANLPFARSGAILAHLLRDPGLPLRRAEVIVQWEFAAKHGAIWPATLRSTYWRAWYDVSLVRRLDRTAFVPPPSVDAAVLRLTRRDRPRVPPELHEPYWAFLTAAFALRGPIRSGLRPLLSPLQVKRLAPVLGFRPDAARARPRRRTVGSALHSERSLSRGEQCQVTVCCLARTAPFGARAVPSNSLLLG